MVAMWYCQVVKFMVIGLESVGERKGRVRAVWYGHVKVREGQVKESQIDISSEIPIQEL